MIIPKAIVGFGLLFLQKWAWFGANIICGIIIAGNLFALSLNKSSYDSAKAQKIEYTLPDGSIVRGYQHETMMGNRKLTEVLQKEKTFMNQNLMGAAIILIFLNIAFFTRESTHL